MVYDINNNQVYILFVDMVCVCNIERERETNNDKKNFQHESLTSRTNASHNTLL